MLINEYRLSPIEPKARKFLVEEMEKFLFGGGSQAPEGFVAPRPRDSLSCGLACRRAAAHATMNDSPPSGATMPSQRGAPAVIR